MAQPTHSRQPCGFRTSSKTCSAKASSLPRSCRSTANSSMPRTSAKPAGSLARSGAALMVVTGLSVLAIVLAARPLTRLLAWGLTDTSFELAVDLTRITAVGIGFMVMSAWCLGILNSHRNFFLPYVAPVIWNVAQIAALLLAWQGGWDIADATRAVAIGVAVGGGTPTLGAAPHHHDARPRRAPCARFQQSACSRGPTPLRSCRARSWSGANLGLHRLAARIVPSRRCPIGAVQGTDPLHPPRQPLCHERGCCGAARIVAAGPRPSADRPADQRSPPSNRVLDACVLPPADRGRRAHCCPAV